MRSFGELARQRLTSWMAANPTITQSKIAAAVGVSQSWVSQYKSADQDADIDQLAAMCRVFEHTLFELFDLRPNPKEQDLIDAYRQLDAPTRDLAIRMLQALASAPPPARGRTRTGER